MDYTMRPARAQDHEAVTEFTQGTFSWGDYVSDRFERWVAEPNTHVVVAVDATDRAVSTSTCRLVTPTEAWLQGARVHPDWRRKGIAGAMARALTDWARDRGAYIARLAVEDWNHPARGQVERDGFTATSAWMSATRSIGAASPVPSGNGGRRVPAPERLVRAHSSDAEPAFMSWSAGILGRAARGLVDVGWTWRRLTPDDLITAARAGAFWSARSGWTLASRNGETLEVAWVDTREEDAADFMRALVDLAANEGTDRLRVTIPTVGWLTQAARRAGCDVSPISVFEMPL